VTQNIISIEDVAHSLNIQLDSGQIRTSKVLDQLSKEIKLNSSNSLLNFFSKTKKTKGVYLYGGVGRGKSMMMDIFFHNIKFEKKRRLHFHDFMKEIHNEIFVTGKKNTDEDPVEIVANNFIKKTILLCFDEMEVKDIADAMILSRLFDKLFSKGLILISTSNQKPENLYKNGLHRERFLPFIKLLNEHMNVSEIEKGKDWRETFLKGKKTWLYPNNSENRKILNRFFDELTKGFIPISEKLQISGREVVIPSSAGGIAKFEFRDICEAHLAAADYIEIADKFKGILIYDIPRLDSTKNNESRRFMWLIDALYDRKCFILASADEEIKKIYVGNQWKFEFERTSSRLLEMSRIS
tara:strand:- start:1526 stop:2587 length:1062 start_codon:yes stop_codon:yes gene_type:complete